MLESIDSFFMDLPQGSDEVDNDIEHRKQHAYEYKKYRERAKLDQCFLCGKPTDKFCNSHTIPQFILKELSPNGLFYHPNSFLNLFIQKTKLGLNEAETFHIICNDCDQKYFQDYENPDNYQNVPNQKILAEIALKCNLKLISKRYLEKEIYQSQQEKQLNMLRNISNLAENQLQIISAEFKDILQDIRLALKVITDKQSNGYYMIDYLVLDYTTKIACQTPITMATGFDHEIINDQYTNYKVKMQNIYICIFPIKGKTHIILFIQDGNTHYRKFYKKFRTLELNEKLKVLNYIIFLYSEEWLLSSNINSVLLKNETLINVIRQTGRFYDILPQNNYQGIQSTNKSEIITRAILKYSLQNVPDIPNFLLP